MAVTRLTFHTNTYKRLEKIAEELEEPKLAREFKRARTRPGRTCELSLREVARLLEVDHPLATRHALEEAQSLLVASIARDDARRARIQARHPQNVRNLAATRWSDRAA